MKWISVKKKLPELDVTVLVWSSGPISAPAGRMNLGWREVEGTAIRGCNRGYDGDSEVDPLITHWMSLPEPPNA